MTLNQIAELIQRLVKNGVVRGRDTLEVEDYLDTAILARDYILFEARKGNQMLYMDMGVVNTEHIFPIQNGVVTFTKGYNPQGISGVELLDNSGEDMGILLLPMASSASILVSESLFSYYFISQSGIKFKGIPKEAKHLKAYNVCGASPDDEVNNAIAFMILQQIMKLGQLSEAQPKHTSADGNGFNTMLQEQIRQISDKPNHIL